MTDRFLFAALMSCLTLGGALAIGSDLARDAARAHEASLKVVQLEPVVVTAKRLAPAAAMAITERAEPAVRRAQ